MANNLFSLRGRRPNVNLLLSQLAFTCPKLTSETVEQTFYLFLRDLRTESDINDGVLRKLFRKKALL